MATKHCSDHFAIYSNIKSLCCTLEINIMLHINYTSIKILTKIKAIMKVKKGWVFFTCYENFRMTCISVYVHIIWLN